MPGADSWLRSPHPPAEVPVRPLEDTHTQAHIRCPASQEGSLSLTVGGTGQVCPQGPFLGSGLKRISQQTGLLPSCSMSCCPRATPASGACVPSAEGAAWLSHRPGPRAGARGGPQAEGWKKQLLCGPPPRHPVSGGDAGEALTASMTFAFNFKAY